MKTTFTIFFVLVLATQAQTYLQMSTTTTVLDEKNSNCCVPCKDKDDALKQMEIIYTNLFNKLSVTATFHDHKHGVTNQSCTITILKEFYGVEKPDMTKSISVESVETNRFALAVRYAIPVTDKTDAAKKEAQIKAEFPDKNFQTKTNGTVTAQ